MMYVRRVCRDEIGGWKSECRACRGRRRESSLCISGSRIEIGHGWWVVTCFSVGMSFKAVVILICHLNESGVRIIVADARLMCHKLYWCLESRCLSSLTWVYCASETKWIVVMSCLKNIRSFCWSRVSESVGIDQLSPHAFHIVEDSFVIVALVLVARIIHCNVR